MLTSAPHHPYRLSKAAAARAQAARSPAGTAEERHARLVEEEDRLLGEVRALLRQRGLDRSTIVVAVGDHGEGFGEKGIRQHDNNFFEEGLHVPWVMAGPGVKNGLIHDSSSLVDVAPTILDLLGVPLTPLAARAVPGRSLLAEPAARRLLVFYCWYDARCRGFVEDGRKVVLVPESKVAFWFDLVADPDERDPKPLTQEMRERLREANHLVDSHRTPDLPAEREPMLDYAPWVCPPGEPCVHPKSPPGGMFGAP